jgi:hypothetical protein
MYALRVVQDVSLGSDEAALARSTQALKAALLEVEEGRRPRLRLGWLYETPPYSCKPEEEIELDYGIELESGSVARNVIVTFFAPPGFESPGRSAGVQLESHTVCPDCVTFLEGFPNVWAEMRLRSHLKVKAGDTPGTYKLYYRLFCDGFVGDYVEIPLVVAV